MKKYSLVKTFTLYSLITFLAIGTILAFVISKHIRNDYYESLYGVVDIVVNNISENILEESDFNKSMDDSKRILIEAAINKTLTQYMPRSFILFNNANEILFKNRQYISQLSENDLKGIDIIRQNNVSYYVSNSYFENDSDKTSVFNFFVPIKYQENIAGILMLQLPEVVVNSHVNMLLKSIVLTMLSGLLILFLLLIRIQYSASKTLRNQNEELVKQKKEIETAYKMLSESYKSTIMALSNAVDARDSYTAGHSERVAKISLLIGKNMKLSLQEVKDLEYAALFHDMGKIGIPDDILLKNSKLTDEEYAVIQRHPVLGVNILQSIAFLKEILPIVKHHHERYDGKGYPDKMVGEDIPLSSRIIAVADTYDAMTSDRPYRKRLTHKVAVSEIYKNKSIQFDPKVVDAFMLLENALFNRYAFEEDLNNFKDNSKHSVIYMDIDDFSYFNNNHGHDAGDEVLRSVATIIKGSIRCIDKAYRYGGEELVVILNDCTKELAINIGNKIVKNIRNHDNSPYPIVTISAGVASIPNDADNFFDLIKAGDIALYKAKEMGKDRLVPYKRYE